MLSLASRSARVSPRFFVTSAVVQEPAAAKKSKSKVAAKKTAAKKKTAATKNPVAQKKKPTEKEAASKKRVVAQKKRLAEKTKQAKALIPRNRIFPITREMLPPKHIPGPFVRFMVAENAKSPKVTTIKDGQARVAELAAKWRTLSEEEKESHRASEQEVAAYRAAKKEWEDKTPADIQWAFKNKGKAKGSGKVHIRITDEKRKYNAYILFVKNYYETVYASSRKPGEGAIQFGAEAAKAWNALSEEERDAWRQKSVAAKAEWAARQAAL
ncbi:hypothetical protein K443DRAFT_676882 [Laccaria amethystina LaAM-08-1]|uniref:HMG box domain-containing protein n=1 Tax=Laccaria amethystina LaAM-08-1 TaxID=1095629 RepID=A0A0C9XZQ1_9AGAR|nr:hypothetical protein K443DRAFT_676882 [Laccaria amethystina LaAM-08-1]